MEWLIAAAALAAPLEPRAECDRVDFAANAAECGQGACALRGDVRLSCSELRLFADQVNLRWDERGDFAGAEAEGHVLLVDGDTVLTCNRLSLGPDRVRGRVEAAEVRVLRPGYTVDPSGIPTGPSRAIVHGDIERLSERALTVADAAFTLCDCGDDPPSWKITAAEMEVDLDDRATLWWPAFHFRPFDLGDVPVPLGAPISLPLRSRAAGMLPPAVRFLGDGDAFYQPTVDLPMFVPLGDAFDVTLAPGYRFDWGAPRAGARVRWAPASAWRGEALVDWTFDLRHAAARSYRLNATDDASTGGPPSAETLAAIRAESDRRAQLTHRVAVDVDQKMQPQEDLTWLVDIDWISDDLIPADFAVSPEQLVSNYAPSRTELLWRRPALAGVLAADYLLSTVQTDAYSNVLGGERFTAHRAPALRLLLAPATLLGPLQLDAEASFARNGPLGDAPPPCALDATCAPEHPCADGSCARSRLLAGTAALGVGLRERLGPVRLGARAGASLLWVDPAISGAAGAVQPEISASAGMLLARRFGGLRHFIEPRVEYAALPLDPVRLGGGDVRAHAAIEERLDLRTFHQAAAVLRQSLHRADGARIAELELSQPVALFADRAALASRLTIAAEVAGIAGAAGHASFDWDRPGDRVDDAGAQLWVEAGPVSLQGGWSRWAPDAERLSRTVYELAGTAPPSDEGWVHAATGGARLSLPRARLAYSTMVLLPVPGAPPVEIEPRPFFAQHALSAGYISGCDCWSVDVSGSLARNSTGWYGRVGVTLTVAGYRVGVD